MLDLTWCSKNTTNKPNTTKRINHSTFLFDYLVFIHLLNSLIIIMDILFDLNGLVYVIPINAKIKCNNNF